MTYTAVVCVRDQAATLGAALRSLRDQTAPPGEIVVVDDASTDGSAAVAAGVPGVRVLRDAAHRGLAAARNRGWRETAIELILYLDADATLAPDFAERLLVRFAADGDGRLAGVGGGADEAGGPSVYDRYRQAFLAQNPAGAVEFLPGIAVGYRRAALAAVGGFDERYATNGEDLDLGLRLRAAGWRLERDSAAVVTHHRTDDRRTFAAMVGRYHYFEGLVRRRHRRPWLADRWCAPLTAFLLTAVRRGPALLWPALLALGARWSAAARLTLGSSR